MAKMTEDKQRDKSESPGLIWFRDDLRLADNSALREASAAKRPLLCVFVLETNADLRPHGAASRWWLHHSLERLARDIEARGGRLDLLHGDSRHLIPALARAAGASRLYFNRRYGGTAARLDEEIARDLEGACEVVSFNGRLLREPWEIRTKTGGSYMVYTPYWRAARAHGAVDDAGDPLPTPARLTAAPYPADAPDRTALAALDLLPRRPDWAAGLRETWTPGEAGARARLKTFLDRIADYPEERNRLASQGTSHLSPHLRFGEISPRAILAAVRERETAGNAQGVETFRAELGWREFDYHVMEAHPAIAEHNLNRKFDAMPWRRPNPAHVAAWQRGQTGYPVVDAGMRQLWRTGYMHNRVRMIAASFLIKDLMVDWRIGERWFWDCLCDADPANNPMNWQWVAGCGADAAPFFRIFNPVAQGEKFDPDGAYVRRWVPELARLDGKGIHAPWTLANSELDRAGVVLGKTYPLPIVDHAIARDKALAAYRRIKG